MVSPDFPDFARFWSFGAGHPPHVGMRGCSMELDKEMKFEALKLRYDDHVELLRFMTKLDVQIFSGYIAVQLALGAWLATNPVQGGWAKAGILLIDIVLAVIAAKLLYNDFKRRDEVVSIIKNINDALHFNTPGAYLPDKSINVPTKTRPWFLWFMIGIVIGVAGIAMVTFGALVCVSKTI